MKITLKTAVKFLPLLRNLRTLKKEDNAGLLYKMDYTGDYYPLLPVLEGFFQTGCTVFAPRTPDGTMLLGRNFDLRHFYRDPATGEEEITGLITVLNCRNKKAKYASVGVCDAMYLDPGCKIFHRGSFDRKDKNTLRALMLPFLTMDGVNEKGLAVSILHLSTDNSFEEAQYREPSTLNSEEKRNLVLLKNPGEEPDVKNGRLTKWSIILNTADKKAWKVNKARATYQTEPGKKTVIHTVLMRMMLDSCQNCEEAIALAKSVNLISTPDSDNHIMVTDPNRSVILEWIDNKLTVEECYHASNFYNNRADRFGYGYNRDNVLKAELENNPGGLSEEECMKALEKASQNCLKGKDHGYTQWSAVYNLKKQTVRIAVHSDYEHIREYSLKD